MADRSREFELEVHLDEWGSWAYALRESVISTHYELPLHQLVSELVVREAIVRHGFSTQNYPRWHYDFHPSFFRSRRLREFAPSRCRVIEWYCFVRCAGLTGRLYFNPERGLWGCDLERFWRYADAKQLPRTYWVGHTSSLDGTLAMLRDEVRAEAARLQDDVLFKRAKVALGGRSKEISNFHDLYGMSVDDFLAPPP